MTNDLASKVTFSEAKGVLVGRILRQGGYELAFENGEKMDQQDPCECKIMGILEPRYAKLFGLKLRKEAVHIGNIYLDSEQLYELNVFGRDYVQKMVKIAEQITTEIGNSVRITLKQDSPKSEYISPGLPEL